MRRKNGAAPVVAGQRQGRGREEHDSRSPIDPGHGFRPRTLDRFGADEAATTAAHGVLLVRNTERITCYG